jgi:hypothetical protein
MLIGEDSPVLQLRKNEAKHPTKRAAQSMQQGDHMLAGTEASRLFQAQDPSPYVDHLEVAHSPEAPVVVGSFQICLCSISKPPELLP